MKENQVKVVSFLSLFFYKEYVTDVYISDGIQ